MVAEDVWRRSRSGMGARMSESKLEWRVAKEERVEEDKAYSVPYL